MMGIVSMQGVRLCTDLSVTLMAREKEGSHPEMLGE